MGAALTAARMTEAGGSLDDFINRIRDAWWRQYRDGDEIAPWVVDVFDDHVVVSRNEADARRYYRVDMSATDDAVTFAGVEAWQEVTLDYVPVAAAAPDDGAVTESLRFDVSLPVREVRTADDGTIDGVIVVEGRSANGNVYSRAALESGLRIFEGAMMFADHPTAVEENQRPERSVRDVVGRVKAPYIGTTKEGKTALRGKFHISESESALRTKIAEGIIDGLSLRAFGQGKRDRSSGDFVVEAFQANPFTSVDVLTVAAAGGGFEALAESDRTAITRAVLQKVTTEDLAEARPDLVESFEVRQLQESPVDEKKLQEVQTENERLLKENTQLFREVRTEKAGRLVSQALGEAKGLPEATQTRIQNAVEPLVEAFATHGSTQTDGEFAAAVKGVIEAETAYLAQLVPNGAVSGGTSRRDLSEAPDEAELDKQIDAELARIRR